MPRTRRCSPPNRSFLAALGLALGLACSSSPDYCPAVQEWVTPAPPVPPDPVDLGNLELRYPNPPVIVANGPMPAQTPQVSRADPALPVRFALTGVSGLPGADLPLPAAPGVPVPLSEPPLVTVAGLPGGLSLDPGTGVIAGTANTPGVFLFTVTASNGTRTAAATLAYTVFPEGAMVLSYPATGAFQVNRPMAEQAPLVRNATPGLATTFELLLPDFPDGLRLDPSTGVISGTPTAAGLFNFTLRASNGTRHAAVSLSYVVTPEEAMTLAYPRWTVLSVGVPMATQYPDLFFPTPRLATSYAVSAGALPPGLSLEAGTGFIQGQPSGPGSYAFTITARNGDRTASVPLTGTVLP